MRSRSARQMAAHRKSDQRHGDLYAAGLRKRALGLSIGQLKEFHDDRFGQILLTGANENQFIIFGLGNELGGNVVGYSVGLNAVSGQPVNRDTDDDSITLCVRLSLFAMWRGGNAGRGIFVAIPLLRSNGVFGPFAECKWKNLRKHRVSNKRGERFFRDENMALYLNGSECAV
jgi:hypothetical protein